MCRLKVYRVISFLLTFAISYTISNLFVVNELSSVEIFEQQSIIKVEVKLTERKIAKLLSERKNCVATDPDLKYTLLNNANEIEKDINDVDTERAVRAKAKVRSAQKKSGDESLREQIKELKKQLEEIHRNEVSPMNLLHTEKCY